MPKPLRYAEQFQVLTRTDAAKQYRPSGGLKTFMAACEHANFLESMGNLTKVLHKNAIAAEEKQHA